MVVRTFKVRFSEEQLNDLMERLEKTRFPDEIKDSDWDYGTNLDYLKELVNYWQTELNWRTQEEVINKFSHFRADVDGINIHFIHQPSKGKNPMPLLLLYGWPYSFLQMLKIIHS